MAPAAIIKMGACTTKQDSATSHKRRAYPKTKLPEEFYLDRTRNELWQGNGLSMRKCEFTTQRSFHADSAAGYTKTGQIIMAGGSAADGSLTDEVFLVDPVTSSVKDLTPLPMKTKEGSLYHYDDWVYFVGGITTAQRDSYLAEVPIPLLRYNMRSKQWETCENGESTEVRKHLYPGTFLMGHSIYFVAGLRVNTMGRPKSTKKVFELSLRNGEHTFKLTPFRFPIKVMRPLCVNGSRHALVVGGFNPKQPEKLYTFSFVLVFDGSHDIKQLEPLPSPLRENYPAIYSREYVLVFTPPHICQLMPKERVWLKFNFKGPRKATKRGMCSGKRAVSSSSSSERKIATLKPMVTPGRTRRPKSSESEDGRPPAKHSSSSKKSSSSSKKMTVGVELGGKSQSHSDSSQSMSSHSKEESSSHKKKGSDHSREQSVDKSSSEHLPSFSRSKESPSALQISKNQISDSSSSQDKKKPKKTPSITIRPLTKKVEKSSSSSSSHSKRRSFYDNFRHAPSSSVRSSGPPKINAPTVPPGGIDLIKPSLKTKSKSSSSSDKKKTVGLKGSPPPPPSGDLGFKKPAQSSSSSDKSSDSLPVPKVPSAQIKLHKAKSSSSSGNRKANPFDSSSSSASKHEIKQASSSSSKKKTFEAAITKPIIEQPKKEREGSSSSSSSKSIGIAIPKVLAKKQSQSSSESHEVRPQAPKLSLKRDSSRSSSSGKKKVVVKPALPQKSKSSSSSDRGIGAKIVKPAAFKEHSSHSSQKSSDKHEVSSPEHPQRDTSDIGIGIDLPKALSSKSSSKSSKKSSPAVIPQIQKELSQSSSSEKRLSVNVTSPKAPKPEFQQKPSESSSEKDPHSKSSKSSSKSKSSASPPQVAVKVKAPSKSSSSSAKKEVNIPQPPAVTLQHEKASSSSSDKGIGVALPKVSIEATKPADHSSKSSKSKSSSSKKGTKWEVGISNPVVQKPQFQEEQASSSSGEEIMIAAPQIEIPKAAKSSSSSKKVTLAKKPSSSSSKKKKDFAVSISKPEIQPTRVNKDRSKSSSSSEEAEVVAAVDLSLPRKANSDKSSISYHPRISLQAPTLPVASKSGFKSRSPKISPIRLRAPTLPPQSVDKKPETRGKPKKSSSSSGKKGGVKLSRPAGQTAGPPRKLSKSSSSSRGKRATVPAKFEVKNKKPSKSSSSGKKVVIVPKPEFSQHSSSESKKKGKIARAAKRSSSSSEKNRKKNSSNSSAQRQRGTHPARPVSLGVSPSRVPLPKRPLLRKKHSSSSSSSSSSNHRVSIVGEQRFSVRPGAMSLRVMKPPQGRASLSQPRKPDSPLLKNLEGRKRKSRSSHSSKSKKSKSSSNSSNHSKRIMRREDDDRFSTDKAVDFVQLVAKALDYPMIEVSQKTTTVKDVEEILGKLLTGETYPVSNLKRVLEEMHQALDKPKLSKFAQSRPLKFCHVSSDMQLLNKDQTVQVLTRALKMMLHPRTK